MSIEKKEKKEKIQISTLIVMIDDSKQESLPFNVWYSRS
jgi:hypothetical protein